MLSKSQDYKLTCFGIHIADITQKIYEVGEIKYEMTKSRDNRFNLAYK